MSNKDGEEESDDELESTYGDLKEQVLASVEEDNGRTTLQAGKETSNSRRKKKQEDNNKKKSSKAD